MTAPILHQILQYPVKSSSPVALQRSQVQYSGLEGDRRYLVTTVQGQFLTGRQHPRLALLQAHLTETGITLAAPNQPPLTLSKAEFSSDYLPATVWRQEISTQHCSSAADQWLSHFLDTPCQLRFYGPQSHRPIKDFPTQTVSFADGYPLLLTTSASLHWLQERCPAALDMLQFRPNLVIAGTKPFAEDNWQQIRIGDVLFRVHSPCVRCKFTTLIPGTETFHPQQEPLRTLLTHRRGHKGGTLFGQNLIPLNEGELTTGSPVEIIASAPVDLVRPPPSPS